MTPPPADLPTREIPEGEGVCGLGGVGPLDDSVSELSMGVAWAKLSESLGQRDEDDLAHVGRFVILGTLGRGAMGVVYRAYDPKLDRRVALKFVQRSGGSTAGSEGSTEVEREARAAADLHHPNIVTIYDVGTHEDRMFLAMELVDGSSLRRFLEHGERTWREIAGLFVPIAHGLAAAHEHGIVHRDFKPDNVLVGSDGRPRIADFGLARPIEGWSARTAARREELGRVPSPEEGSTPSTIGGLCGTPAYMAPEQFKGEAVGPAADQFAFCVSLYEALVGARPHAGSSVEELSVKVVDGQREPLPPRHGLPRRLVELVERGMALEPRDRFPSMDALAEQLQRILGARRRRRVAVAVGSVGLLALVGGVGLSSLAAEQPCEDAEALLGETWNDEHRARILETWPAEALVTRLDDYAREWAQRRRATCERTRIQGAQSELAMELQVACLERAKVRLDAVVTALTEGSADGSLPAVEDILLPLASCDDVAELERYEGRFAERSAFDSERARALHLELDRRISELEARRRLGRDVEQPLREVAGRARDAGLRHEEAEARYVLGKVAHQRGDLDAAEESYRSALSLALATGWDHLAERLLVLRVQLMLDTDRIAQADAFLEILEGLSGREARPGMEREPAWQVISLRANVALAEGDDASAEALLSAAQQQATATEPPTSDVLLRLSNNLANVFQARGKYTEAAEEYGRILAVLEARGEGDSHTAAAAHANLALAHTNLQDYEQAPAHYERGLAIVEALNPDHPMAQMILNNWGWMEREQGRLDSAQDKQERALAIAERAFGEGHPTLAHALDELGEVALARGELDDAARRFERSIEVRSGGLGADHPMLATAWVGLGEVSLGRGEIATARERFERARSLLGDPPDDEELAERVRVGLAQTTAGDPSP